MQHADEGHLNAYLDGELAPSEVVELERHLSVCAPCRTRLAEAKSFMGEADELVTLLDHVAPGTKAPATGPVVRRAWPVRPATLAWAATVVLAAGVGYVWRGEPVLEKAVAAATQATDAASTVQLKDSAVPAQPAANEATPRPAPEQRYFAERRSADPKTSRALAAAEVEAPAAPAPAPLRQEQDAVTGVSAAVASSGLAAKMSDSVSANGTLALVDGVPVDTSATLHRQYLAFGPATTAEPKRITLDQAVDLLGGSIQLIDGLTPQRVELLAGIDVEGADPERQVVRVYYEEPDLGLVTLDQQRPGPSFDARRPESPTAAPQVTVIPSAPQVGRAYRQDLAALSTVTWRTDGTWLALTSRLPADRAAQLRARVK